MGTHGYFRPMVFIVKPLSNYAKPGTPFIRLFWLSFQKLQPSMNSCVNTAQK